MAIGPTVNVREYAQAFGISTSTARRRLDAMAEAGACRKRYASYEHPVNQQRVGIPQWVPNIRECEYTFDGPVPAPEPPKKGGKKRLDTGIA